MSDRKRLMKHTHNHSHNDSSTNIRSVARPLPIPSSPSPTSSPRSYARTMATTVTASPKAHTAKAKFHTMTSVPTSPSASSSSISVPSTPAANRTERVEVNQTPKSIRPIHYSPSQRTKVIQYVPHSSPSASPPASSSSSSLVSAQPLPMFPSLSNQSTANSPICQVCSCLIVDDQKITIVDSKSLDSYYYHTHHFTCQTCHIPLNEQTAKPKQGVLYCEQHFPYPTCYSCNVAITGTVLSTLGRYYHPEHFTCVVCHTSFNGQYFPYNNQPYCATHWNELTDICHLCQQEVKMSQVKIVNGQHYHAACLSCCVCSTSKGTMVKSKQKMYCQQDFNALHSHLCSQCGVLIDGEPVCENGEYYHPSCLVCGICRDKLDVYCSVHGQLRCSKHQKLKGEAKACALCSARVDDDRELVKSMGKIWHRQCYICTCCGEQVDPATCQLKDGKLCCVGCWLKDRQKKDTGVLADVTQHHSNKKQHTESLAAITPPSPSSSSSSFLPPKSGHSRNRGHSDNATINHSRSQDMNAMKPPAPLVVQLPSLLPSSSVPSALPSPSSLALPPSRTPSPPRTPLLAATSTQNPPETPRHKASSSITTATIDTNIATAAAAPGSGSNNNSGAVTQPPPSPSPPPPPFSSPSASPPVRVSSSPLSHTPTKVTLGRLIAEGTFGCVYEARDDETGDHLAVKVMKAQDAAGVETEIALMKDLRHPNIVSFRGTQHKGNELHIYMEFVPGRSLDYELKQFGSLHETLIKKYTKQLLSALAYCHANHVVHRDIKGKNILVGGSGQVKLADFGSAKRFQLDKTSESATSSYNFTPLWTAPEVMNGDYNNKVDIWSLGCVIIEMASGKPPWSEKKFNNPWNTLHVIGNSTEIPAIPDSLSPAAQQFVRLMLTRDAKQRPSAAELLTHPWLSEKGGSGVWEAAQLHTEGKQTGNNVENKQENNQNISTPAAVGGQTKQPQITAASFTTAAPPSSSHVSSFSSPAQSSSNSTPSAPSAPILYPMITPISAPHTPSVAELDAQLHRVKLRGHIHNNSNHNNQVPAVAPAVPVRPPHPALINALTNINRKEKDEHEEKDNGSAGSDPSLAVVPSSSSSLSSPSIAPRPLLHARDRSASYLYPYILPNANSNSSSSSSSPRPNSITRFSSIEAMLAPTEGERR